jgi:hypothetical protein
MNTAKRPWWSASGAGIGRVLLVVFIGVWVVEGVVYAGGLINHVWLTPSEKRAGAEALKDIDAVRNSTALDDRAYDALIQRAEAAVAETDKVAFTFRDHWVSGMLNTDLHVAKVQCNLQRARQHAVGEDARRLEILTPIDSLGSDSDNQVRRVLGVSR